MKSISIREKYPTSKIESSNLTLIPIIKETQKFKTIISTRLKESIGRNFLLYDHIVWCTLIVVMTIIGNNMTRCFL